MSKHGAPTNVTDPAKGSGIEQEVLSLKVAMLAASWHEVIMDGLINGAQRAAKDAGLEQSTTLIRVMAPLSCRLPQRI